MSVIRDSQGRGIDANNPLQVIVAGGSLQSSGTTSGGSSDSMQPVDIQSRYSQTIQTHNAVSLAINGGSSNSSYIDADGFDSLQIHLISSLGGTSDNDVRLYWSNDGVNSTTYQSFSFDGVVTHDKKVSVEIKLKARYFMIQARNLNATTTSTVSTYAYLKA